MITKLINDEDENKNNINNFEKKILLKVIIIKIIKNYNSINLISLLHLHFQ